MQKRLVAKSFGVLVLSLSLTSGLVGCKKKSEADSSTTQRPETIVPEVEVIPPPAAFAVGDDFNRVDVDPHTDAPTLEDAQATLVTGAWSTFRGNDARTGLRDAPSIQKPRIAWRTEIGILGYSNVIAERDGRLYVSTQGKFHEKSDEWDGIVAVDAHTGKLIWRYRTESDANGMTLHGDALYVVTTDGHVHAVNIADGSQIWNRNLDCGRGMRTAPTVVGHFVHILRDGKVVRLFRENGSPELELSRCQSLERGGLSYDDGVFVSASTADRTRLFDGTTRVWTSAPNGGRSDYIATWNPSLLLSGLVIQEASAWPYALGTQDFRGDEEFRYAPTLLAYWRDNGELAWSTELDGVDPEAQYRASNTHNRALPLVVGSKVFAPTMFRPELSVLDVRTGQRIGGVAMPDCRARQFSSPVGTLQAGYYARHDGVLYQFDYDTQKVNWSIALGKAGLSGQPTTHERITTPGSCSVAPVDGTALFASPTIGGDGTVYVGSGEGWLYAIGEGTR